MKVSITKDGCEIQGSPLEFSFFSQIGRSGRGDLGFDGVQGLAIDDQGQVFAADKYNHQIQCFRTDGTFLFRFDSPAIRAGWFFYPMDLAFEAKNKRILATDSIDRRVHAFDLQGRYLLSFGFNGSGPFSIGADQEGNVYLTDTRSNCIHVFDEKGALLREIGPNFDNRQEPLRSPFGIGFFPDGRLVVGEVGGKRISVLNQHGAFLSFVGEEEESLENPSHLFVDQQGRIYVVDKREEGLSLVVFSPEGRKVDSTKLSLLSQAEGIAVSPKGDIFVAGRSVEQEYCVLVF